MKFEVKCFIENMTKRKKKIEVKRGWRNGSAVKRGHSSTEDLDLVPSTHMVAYNNPKL